MPATVEGRHLTEQHRRARVQLRDAFLSELIRLGPLLSWSALDITGVAWVRAVMAILRTYRQRSADRTASYRTPSGWREYGPHLAGREREGLAARRGVGRSLVEVRARPHRVEGLPITQHQRMAVSYGVGDR